MLESDFFYERLRESGIDFFTGVPDSLLKDICAYFASQVDGAQHIIAANEGGAVALAVGHYLGTGSPALVYMQNSGQGNAINPLLSLADPEVYGIPMVLMVGWRGEPGIKDEPQHIKQGRVMSDLFEAMEIPFAVLPDTEQEAATVIEQQVHRAVTEKKPVALVVRSGTFHPFKLAQPKEREQYPLAREEAIACITAALEKTAVVVSTTGKASRELCEYRDRTAEGHARDFLTVGGMGHASSIAFGLALAQPHRTVCCLDGDGAALMHLGAMGIIGSRHPANFKHVILNNGAHDSVGGQPSVGFDVDFCYIALAMGYKSAIRASSLAELRTHLPCLIKDDGPVLLEVRISIGARSDLGRPKASPEQNKLNLMEFLQQ